MSKNTQLGNLVNGIFVDSTGKVGVGTTSPTVALDVVGAGKFSGSVTASSLSSPEKVSTIFGINAATSSGNGGSLTIKAGNGSGAGNTSGSLNLGFGRGGAGAASGSMNFGVAQATDAVGLDATYMTLTSSGNVGIGTTNPATASGSFTSLDIRGSTGASLVMGSTATLMSYVYVNTSGLALETTGTIPIVFNPAGTERMRIFVSGNVRFSSQVYGNTVSSPRTLFIAADGELGGISSIRESKTNINSIDSNWLMQLNPVSFNYRKKDEDGKYTNEHYNELFYGLIAEEAEIVNKEICTYNEDKLVGIEYSKLVPVLVKAIQELKAEIDILKNK